MTDAGLPVDRSDAEQLVDFLCRILASGTIELCLDRLMIAIDASDVTWEALGR